MLQIHKEEELTEFLNNTVRLKQRQKSYPDITTTESVTVGKKINAVKPFTRSEGSFPILATQSASSSETKNEIDISHLERQCKDLEEHLNQVKHQISEIVNDKNCATTETEKILRNYQIAFNSLTEQNQFLRRKLEEDTKMFHEPVSTCLHVPEIDRTSPDGQEVERNQSLVFKSSLEYETEIERLINVNKDLAGINKSYLQELDQNKGMKEINLQLEESLDLMREEFESMEDYWQKKLEDERKFYEEQLKESETHLKHLEGKLKEYDEILLLHQNERQHNSNEIDDDADDEKLSTIEETFSLECQVNVIMSKNIYIHSIIILLIVDY